MIKRSFIWISIISIVVAVTMLYIPTSGNNTFQNSKTPARNTDKVLIVSNPVLLDKPNETETKRKNLIENHPLFYLIEIVNNPNSDKNYQLSACEKLSSSVNLDPYIHPIMVKTLNLCRSKKNSFGVSEQRINEKLSIQNTIKSQGWEVIINQIKSGELSASSGLQSTTRPMHNLLSTFVVAGATDIEAYEALIEFGIEPNAIFLSSIMMEKNYELLSFYEKHADIFSLNDMQRNIVFSAAAFGDLDMMEHFLDKGVSYKDELDRDPLLFHLNRFGIRIDANRLDQFVEKFDVELTKHHLDAAYKLNASTEFTQLIKKHMAENK